MSAVEVTITGVLYDKLDRTSKPVVLIGEAFLTGLGVGGGPIIPPDKPPVDPPSGGRPTFPIVLPPGGGWMPGFTPGPGYPPYPAHPGPILPDHPTEPPIDVPPDAPPESIVKPPPADGGWGWSPAYGWGYFPGTSNPGPKK